MPTELADIRRVFRSLGGDRDWMPQHRAMPSEKQHQDGECERQPDRQPDQRAAEGFFGGSPVPQGAQHEGEEQAYQAVAEVEGQALEREYRRAPARLDQGVQIIGEDKPEGDDGRAEREREYHAPPPPAQRQSRKGRQGHDRQQGEVSRCRAPLHHAPRHRRDNETECPKPGPDQTVTGCRQINQPEIRAGERKEQPDYGVEQQACKNHEKRKRRVRDPRARGQHKADRVFLARQRPVIYHRGTACRFPALLPQAEGNNEREHGRDEVEINWKTKRRALRESAGPSERASDPVHKPWIIDRAADEHGYHHAHGLPAGDLVEYLRPFRGSSALGEGVEHERLVSATRQALSDAAEQSVRQAKKKEHGASACRSHAKHRHFYHHSDCGRDDERPASEPIRERAGRQVGADDGECPGEIQQRVLGCAEAKVEEQNCQHRVIKPRVEEHAEKNEAPPVAVGGIAGIGGRHGGWAILSAFSSVPNTFRNSLVAIAMALAALLPFSELARSQEPARVPTAARTRLVVGLTQSPPFCMRGEDGSWSGISVELWQGIAADLGIDTEFRETSVTGLFDDLAPGRPLDVSIGALTITAEREDRLDFTQPFFLSGLGVAVKTAPGAGGLWSWLGRVLAWNFWRIVAGLLRLAHAGGTADLGAGAQGQPEGVWRRWQGTPGHRLRPVVGRGDDDDRRLR